MRSKLLFTEIISIIFLTYSAVQAQTVKWQVSIGGSNNDYCFAITNTDDGGTIAVGQTYSDDGDVTFNHGDADVYVVKLDSVGEIQWQKSFGGSYTDWANSVTQTQDGGYIIAGVTNSKDGDITVNHGSDDYWLIKIDSNGNLEWQETLGGIGNDVATTILQTANGDYVIAGTTYSNDGEVTFNHGSGDCWILKLDIKGNIIWQNSLGGSEDDEASSIEQTVDGGYIVGGYTKSKDGDVINHHSTHTGWYDYWLVKLDARGNIEWNKCLGGANDDFGNKVKQTSDRGYVMVGSSLTIKSGDIKRREGHGNLDYWIVKTDSLGNVEWQKIMGGASDEACFDVVQNKDNSYLIAGYSASGDGDVDSPLGFEDYWLIKLSQRGKYEGQLSLGGSLTDVCSSIIQSKNGDFVLAGYSYSNDDDVTGNHGNADVWIVDLSDQTINKGIIVNRTFSQVDPITLAPNPSLNSFNLFITKDVSSATVLDLSGRIIENLFLQTDNINFGGNYLPGVYIVRIQLKDGTQQTMKIIKE